MRKLVPESIDEAFHLRSPFQKKNKETSFKTSKAWKEKFSDKPDPIEDEINELTPDNESGDPAWYEEEIAATFLNYGMEQPAIDQLLSDPNIQNEISRGKERGIGPEKTALYLLQQADERDLFPSEEDAFDQREMDKREEGYMGDIKYDHNGPLEEYDQMEEEHPADGWQKQEADRRYERDNAREVDPEEYEEPLDEAVMNEVSLGAMYREMGTWMRLDPRMQKIADESGIDDTNSEDLQYLVNGWTDGQYDEDPDMLMSELEQIINSLNENVNEGYGQDAERVLSLVSDKYAAPTVSDIVSFIVDNWEDVTGTPRSEMYAEQDFPDVIQEIMEIVGIDADEFGEEWIYATEGEEDSHLGRYTGR